MHPIGHQTQVLRSLVEEGVSRSSRMIKRLVRLLATFDPITKINLRRKLRRYYGITLRGKSPRARDVARIPATRHTPLNEMKPPAS